MIRSIKAIFLFSGFIFLFSCGKKASVEKLFEVIPANYSNVHFTNQLVDNDSQNIIQDLFFYNGSGIGAGDINNDGLVDLYFTSNQGDNKLYLNLGDFQFKDITNEAGVANPDSWSTGVSMADVNADGYLDIYVSQVSYKSYKGKNKLYINNGDLTFSEQAAEYNLDFEKLSMQSAFFDYDLDGDLDMFLLCYSVHTERSHQNISIRSTYDSLSGDKLMRNDTPLTPLKGGNFSPSRGVFTDVTNEAGIWSSTLGYGLGLAISDINLDGYPDIYVGNDFHENDYLYYNNGDGTFSDRLPQSVGHATYYSMGNDIADFNNDGKPDIISLDMRPKDDKIYKSSVGPDSYEIQQFKLSYGFHHQYSRNVLQLNMGNLWDGKAHFADIAQLSGLEATDWSWSSLFADLDNDGWKDIYITNGVMRRPNDLDYMKYLENPMVQKNATDIELAHKIPPGKAKNFCFRNTTDLLFTDVSEEWGLDQNSFSNGSVYADLDNDGDLDLIVNNINEQASILKNRSNEINPNNFIKLKLAGDQRNTFGIGAKVTVYSNHIKQNQELFPVRGYLSSVDYSLNFGVGNADIIDSIKVRWNDGKVSLLTNITTNQILEIDRGEAAVSFGNPPDKKETFPFFKKARNNNNVDFMHLENKFISIDREKLLPHRLSAMGPKIAVADVNADGLDDMYICGAQLQAPALFVQLDDGNFQHVETTFWEEEKNYEDVDAVFFHANSDVLPDLFVISGGNEYIGKNRLLKDRLYLNEGNGQFKKAESNVPDYFENGSCVKPCDFDLDGDMDLFVGTQNLPLIYGLPPDNYLLVNDGNGNLSIDKNFSLKAMVSDAVWTDVNDDERLDLVVAGAWGNITIMVNEKDGFEKEEINHTSGWWNCIAAADFDNDGDVDLMVGNMGQNTNLKASVEEPVKLYVADFDQDKNMDRMLTYYREGREVPVVHYDELQKEFNPGNLFKSYTEYASSDAKYVYSKMPSDKLFEFKIKENSSLYLENDGEGNFIPHALPIEIQFAPVHSILPDDLNDDGLVDAVLAGNFYEYQPAIGRMDASYGWVLINKGKGKFEVIYPEKSGFSVNGQVRDIEQFTSLDGSKFIIAATNNDTVKVFQKLMHSKASIVK